MQRRLTMLVALCTAPGLAQAQAIDRLQQVLDESRETLGANGASAAIVRPDGSMWIGVSGLASAGLPVDSATVFEVASITKTFTAALALQLVSEGALGLDDRLTQFLPEFSRGAGVTLRQLLNHTSGLHDPLQDASYVPSMLRAPGRVWTAQDVLDLVAEPTFPPGEGWHYSNTGYVALGAVMQRIEEISIGEQFRRRFFQPLGLSRTFYVAEEQVMEPRAHPFVDVNSDSVAEDLSLLIPNTAFITSGGAAGAVAASAADLARWIQALHTGAVLSDSVYAEMTRFVDRPDGNRYGLGLLFVERDGVRLFGHRGNGAGFSAAAWHLPDEHLTIAVLTNANGVSVQPIVDALLAAERSP